MKVRMKGRDGGDVVCFINPENYDPQRMEAIDTEDQFRRQSDA